MKISTQRETPMNHAHIHTAEALLHMANAEYGVAIAKLYPQVNLSTGLGILALTADTMLSGSSTVWNLVGQLSQPLFKPCLPAEKRAAIAGFDAASVRAGGSRYVQETQINLIEAKARRLIDRAA